MRLKTPSRVRRTWLAGGVSDPPREGRTWAGRSAMSRPNMLTLGERPIKAAWMNSSTLITAREGLPVSLNGDGAKLRRTSHRG